MDFHVITFSPSGVCVAPVFQLSQELIFPPVALAEPNGLLAVGGDLSPRRLLLAYGSGIFPWYSRGEPILWWSPDPRMVLKPAWLHLSRSLRKGLRRADFRLTMDHAFDEVMAACGVADRPGQEGTWITPAMRRAYGELHRLGYAHSVEAWQGEALVGGLYGVALGGCFYGESMFHHVSDASKAAFVHLMEWLPERGFTLVDCQMNTHHLARFGAREVSREAFLADLAVALRLPGAPGSWRGA